MRLWPVGQTCRCRPRCGRRPGTSLHARPRIWRRALGGHGGREVRPTHQRYRGSDRVISHLREKPIGHSGIHARPLTA